MIPANGLSSAIQSAQHAASPYRTWILIGLVILAGVFFSWLVVRTIRHVSQNVEAGAQSRLDKSKVGTEAYSAAETLLRRTKTASKLIANSVIWVQVALTVIIILGILGVNLTALIASAGVVAAVLTFSAQNIIKDVITGAFMVAEDQLDVGDYVNIGTGHGVVEFVGLRVTQVRDDYGVLWSVRNGDIAQVANYSRGWLNSVIDIDFAPATDLDSASSLVLEALTGAIGKYDTSGAVLNPPTCFGVTKIDADSVTLRFITRMNASAFPKLDPKLRESVQELLADGGNDLQLGHQQMIVLAQNAADNKTGTRIAGNG